MIKLKSLKEIDISNTDGTDISRKDIIKQEAIKWYKDLEGDINNSPSKERSRGSMNWIEMFFDIDGEDLI